jgi:hypothetical protein
MEQQSKKIRRIQSFQLPSRLPDKRILNSSEHKEVHYDPEFWEFEYLIDRYLENINDTLLTQRYEAIARNFSRLVGEDRHTISIFSFLSSWYWYRKEHQTRLEFDLRNLSLPVVKFKSSSIEKDCELPALPKYPNSGDVIFRFGSSKYMEPMIERGEIRIGHASQYKQGQIDDPRTDDELNKHAFISGNNCRIITESGIQISPIGDVKRTISAQDYFVICSACGYHPELFNDFSADCCIVIHDPEEFASRIDLAFRHKFDESWLFHHNPVEYFDPYEMHRNGLFDAVMCKDFSYAYQMEYRFVWLSTKKQPAEGYHHLDVGSLKDIASLHLI